MPDKLTEVQAVSKPTESCFTKKIGTTVYNVAVHFSKTSNETMNDKITRMIKNDTHAKEVVNL